jgi:nucleotide-binding universal stress UspA family protein
MYEVILVAVDGSKHSAATIQAVAELAKAFRSEVVVVHARQVVQSVIVAGPDAVSLPVLTGGEEMAMIERELEAAARHLVDNVTGELTRQGVKAKAVVASGRSTARSILKAAEDCDAGLIVIGSNGLSDLTGLLMGSVAHQVVQHAHCPVLVVRGEG